VSSPLGLDGRTARRHRNTDAVLDAVHQLFVEGEMLPSVEDIALRSGVSLRSIYRYFPDRDELLRAAMNRRLQVAEPFFELDGLGSGSLSERIERLVEHRIELYGRIAPTARAALQVAPTAPLIAEMVRLRRTQLTEQVRQQFAPELAGLADDKADDGADGAADDLVAAIDVLCQFEALDSLLVDRDFSAIRTRRVLVRALGALLGGTAPG
jgi:AcrR family transcriptional regulator